MATRVLSLPGWTSSGPRHWQTLWERIDARITRVEQASWDFPVLSDWRARVHEALEASPEPTVLLGHSLGAVLIAHVGLQAKNVIGALLVAPPDLEAETAPLEVRGFRSTFGRLPFPTTLIASRDDRYATFEASARLATTIGAELIDAGAHGHLNTDSGLGTWPFGWEALRRLRSLAPFQLDPRLEQDSVPIATSALTQLRVFDEARYPWFLLVPTRPGIEELAHLDEANRRALIDESSALVTAIREVFGVDKVNVGALGNVVRQFHLHHVGRSLEDPAWPGPVWGHSARHPDPTLAHQRGSRLLAHPSVAARFAPLR